MPQNIQASLEKLRSLDGYIGACIADSESAMSLGIDGGGPTFNMEIAAAGNAEVLKSKRKVAARLNLKDDIEDVLISLGRQYHLIRPLKSRPSIFLYVALDRQRANLALARFALSDVEKVIELS